MIVLASTNAQQWNPTSANQETDAQYTSDAQRIGGASNPSEFNATLANKLFYQLTTYVAALGTMLANKGISNADTSLSALVTAMSNIVTTADIRANLQSVAYASTLTLNAGSYLGFQIALAGNISSLGITGQQAGDIIVLMFLQNGTGGNTVTFSSSFSGAVHPDPAPNVLSVQAFKVNATLTLEPIGPNVSVNGIGSTPIGATAPSTGAFTSLSASSSATAPTVAESDSSTHVATTAWVRGAWSSGSSGGAYWSKDPSGLIRQWGHVSGLSNSANTISFPTSFTNSSSVVVNATDDFFTGGSVEMSVVHGSPTINNFQIWASSGGNGAWWEAVGY